MTEVAYIRDIGRYAGGQVTIRGWLYNKRSSGKIHFLIVRDGTGFIQAVMAKNDVPPEVFELGDKITQESSIIVTGTVREDKRAPGGFELAISDIQLVSMAEEYPIALKEHGVDFLLENRHLCIRTQRQHAILTIRDEVIRAATDFLAENGFVRVDAPILTPAACEGSTTLFETDYFGEPAFLSQSGQLYNEATCMAFGKVYCFGTTFRAEKSKTRRHLMEFWMLEPEMAYYDQEANMEVQENLVSYIVQRVLEKHRPRLEFLGRDLSKLEVIKPPFPRITYDEALDLLKQHGEELPWGEDFGAPHETILSNQFEKPLFVTRYPAKAKAFYMQPDPERPEVVLCADLLAPEGYGEIIGGSQRIHDLGLLESRMRELGMDTEPYKWYLDLRRYGSVPHSGFGIGIERTITWICGLDHLRETIPFPRMLNRIYP